MCSGYMPPEYLFGNLVSNKLDIFSLGVAMTKIIAGHNGHDELLDQVRKLSLILDRRIMFILNNIMISPTFVCCNSSETL